MKVRWIVPAERFDTTSVSTEIVDGKSLPPTVTYTCPNCHQRIGFTRSNLENAIHRVALLPDEAAAMIDADAKNKGHAKLGFLDWTCPTCKLMGRAYIETWAGGKADSGANIISVAELD